MGSYTKPFEYPTIIGSTASRLSAVTVSHVVRYHWKHRHGLLSAGQTTANTERTGRLPTSRDKNNLRLATQILP